jgi:hypothetical protein
MVISLVGTSLKSQPLTVMCTKSSFFLANGNNISRASLKSGWQRRGNQYMVFKEIVDHWKDPKIAVKKVNQLYHHNGTCFKKKTIARWQQEVEWQAGTMSYYLPLEPKGNQSCPSSWVCTWEPDQHQGITIALLMTCRVNTNLRDTNLEFSCQPVWKCKTNGSLE